MERQLPSPDDLDDRGVGDGLKLITIPAAAKRLGLSRSKLYGLIAGGELPTVRIGRARRIALTDLRVFIARRRTLG